MAKTNKVTVRVLVAFGVDGKEYQPDQAVSFDADKAKQLQKAGQVDAHPDAVTYLKSQGVKVIEHDDGAEAAETAQTGGAGEGAGTGTGGEGTGSGNPPAGQ